MIEDFDKWNELKKQLNSKKELLKFRARDVYFMSVGQNIGHESYGKGDEFLRPVLVYKKLSKETFIGIPLTSKVKEGTYFFNFNLNEKKSTASLNQLKVFDIKRAKYFYGTIGENTYDKLVVKMIDFMDITSQKGRSAPKGKK